MDHGEWPSLETYPALRNWIASLCSSLFRIVTKPFGLKTGEILL